MSQLSSVLTRFRRCGAAKSGAASILAIAPALLIGTPVSAHAPINPPEPLGDVSQWFSGDNYPPAAMRAGQEGMVSVTLAINPEGLVSGCRVTQSSGVPTLDDRTCILATRRGRFAPARQGDQAVAATYDLRNVEWRIRDMSVHVARSTSRPPSQ